MAQLEIVEWCVKVVANIAGISQKRFEATLDWD